MSKILSGFTGLFVFFILLFPVPGYAQRGEDSAEALRGVLEGRDIPWEEGFLFSTAGDESSVLVRFRRPAGTGPLNPAGFDAEIHAGFSPLFIAAFPLDGSPGPEGELPYRFRAALELIEKIRHREAANDPLPMDMIIAFLGTDDLRVSEGSGDSSVMDFAGYGDIIEDPEKTFFWYLDPGETPQSLVIRHGTSETIAPLYAIRNLPEICGALDIPYTFAVPFTELHKLRLVDGPDLLRFVQAREINALFFSGAGNPGPGGAGSGKIIPEGSLAEFIIRYAGSLVIPEDIPDYHYAIFSLPGTLLFLSQEAIVLLFLFTAGAFLLGFLLHRGFHPPPAARFRIFIRCFWIIPAFFFLLFLCLTGAGLFISLFFTAEETDVSLIYGWAGFKLLLALGVFFLFNLPLKGYRIPRKANFYGAGAFLIILLDALIAAWADIAFIPFFTGALLVIFLGMLIKFAVPVFLCAILAPFYGILALLFALNSGDGALGELLLSGVPSHTFMTALIVLPFILLFKRGLTLARRGKPPLPLRLSLIPPGLLLVAAGILAVFLFFTR
ncbi:MAG: hypothetical protein LBG10_09930 [Treponema sp.]|nr:hypothetical protein [Treponema sp.]